MSDNRRLRSVKRVDYSELSDVKLPREKKAKVAKEADRDKLYPVEIVEQDDSNGRFKVHYIGYSSQYDEWRDNSDVISLNCEHTSQESMDPESARASETNVSLLFPPFSLYNELSVKVKCALSSRRKENPSTRIDMPFDKLLFDGGLKAYGIPSRLYRGTQRYKIVKYKDLNPLLGPNWHYRGLNCNGDFCFVILNTIEYYLFKRDPLKEYIPSEGSEKPTLKSRDLGYMLVFSFVRGDGTKSDFGKDKNIFC